MTNEDEAIVARLGDGDWRTRRAALEEAVARVASADASARDATVAALVRAVGSDENAGLRSAALETLTRVAPAAASGILAALEGAPVDVQILLAPALGESGAAEAVPALVALAASEDTNVAAAALIGLGRTRRREALAPLLDALGKGDPWLVGPAAEALGALGDARAAGPLAQALDDPFVRATALDALARLATPESARALAARIFSTDGVDALALADADPAVRRAAVAALARSDDPRARDAVLSACGDAHDVVAAAALSAVEAERAEAALALAAREGRTLVRCVAAERLAASAEFRSRALAAGLATDDPEPDVRRAAVAAFARRPSSEAAGVADAALGDANRGVRSAAVRLAAALGERSCAARVLAAAESDPDGDVRGEALVALADLDADAALARAGRGLLDPSLAVYAYRALARVGRTDPVRLARYRDGNAPPRAAIAADAILSGEEE